MNAIASWRKIFRLIGPMFFLAGLLFLISASSVSAAGCQKNEQPFYSSFLNPLVSFVEKTIKGFGYDVALAAIYPGTCGQVDAICLGNSSAATISWNAAPATIQVNIFDPIYGNTIVDVPFCNYGLGIRKQGSATITTYKIPSNTDCDKGMARGNPNTDNAFTINSGLSNNTTYIWVVEAYYGLSGGSGITSQAAGYTNQPKGTFTTPDCVPPAAPTNANAAVSSCSQINVSWQDNSNNEDGFKIERRTDTTGWIEIATVGANIKTYPSTGLVENTKYYYRVRSYNANGNSASYSNEVNATTVFCPWVDLKVNGSDSPPAFNYNGIGTISWNTKGVNTCNASSPDWSGSKAVPSGSEPTGSLTSSKLYILSCSNGLGQSAQDSVSVAVNQPANNAPIAEAGVQIPPGAIVGYNNPLQIVQGQTVNLKFYADQNVDGIPGASNDPDGWTDALNGVYSNVSSGGKCEWNTDLNPGAPTFETIINNPAAVSDCNIGPFTYPFNDAPGTYTYGVLKITDKNGAASGVSSIRVTVLPKPDLNITLPGYTPAAPVAGNQMSFSATVRNEGGSPSAASLTRVLIDNVSPPSTDKNTGSLNVGATEAESWSNVWTATTGTHKYEICSDVTGLVNESDETNNCYSQTFSVSSGCTAPSIVTQPQNQTINSGQSANLSVSASGSSPLSYQWYQGNSGNTSNPIAGATGSSFNTGSLFSTTNYWVRVSGSCGSPVDSNTAIITVSAAPADITLEAKGPTGSFTAGSITINRNESADLRWNTTNVNNCTASNSTGVPSWTGSKPDDGGPVSTGSMTNSTTFVLTCNDNSTGLPISGSVKINVAFKPWWKEIFPW